MASRLPIDVRERFAEEIAAAIAAVIVDNAARASDELAAADPASGGEQAVAKEASRLAAEPVLLKADEQRERA